MAKYYAVRNGYKIGIFGTWDECKKQVNGFSGAEYKSFTSLEDAKAFISGNVKVSDDTPSEDCAVAYVDGSFNVKTGEYACGVIIFYKGEEITFSKKFSDPENAVMRNVAGEIEGAMLAMRFCVDNYIEEIRIYYDYAGIEKWCNGDWKTNKVGTIAYKNFYDEISRSVKVNFVKVKGHSGDKYNDVADRLAKDALGIK